MIDLNVRLWNYGLNEGLSICYVVMKRFFYIIFGLMIIFFFFII